MLGKRNKDTSSTVTNRLVDKYGRTNITTEGIRGWRKRYVYDFFTTMVDIRWRWNILIFVGGFVVTWLIFAVFYWIIGFFNGDYDDNDSEEPHIPCIKNQRSFLSAYLFSIETQSTIGYGFFYVTEECLVAYTCVLIQSILGAALQAALAGLVVAKVRRGRRDNNTIIFSSFGCIYYDDQCLKLSFRIADTMKVHAINANVKGYLFRKELPNGGKPAPAVQQLVKFSVEGGCNGLYLAWPQQIIHTIDESSPFWDVSKQDLQDEDFELILAFFGEVATVGRPFEADYSYLPCDIKWGCNFEPLEHKIDNEYDRYSVDVQHFNGISPVSTPICSAKKLKQSMERKNKGLPEHLRRNIRKEKPSPLFSRRNSVADEYQGTDVKLCHEAPTFSALPQ